MPSVARLTDTCTGHACWPPRPNTQGSPNVFVNGRPVHRQSDSWAPHTCGDNTHGGNLSSGSSTVFANGLSVGRIGDPVSCGSAVSVGSPNVFAGG